MPVKNTEQYLRECLDSILNQSFKDWELIAINDHSTDSSFNILREYVKKDNRIRAFNNEGKGIINALRLAYQHSKGNLITRMDSDDIMHVSKLEKLFAQIIRVGNGHIAVSKVSYFSKEKVGQGYLNYAKWLNNLCETKRHYHEIYKECVIPSPAWLIYRHDLDKVNAFNPNTYPEDYDLCFRFYQHQINVVPVLDILHHWRDYPERTSRNDKHYADNRFLDLKVHYFLNIDYNSQLELVLWGAGRKGKEIAKKLIDNQIRFHWICNNEKKIGKSIYNVVLKDYKLIHSLSNFQTIIAVSSPDEQASIKEYFELYFSKPIYWFFC